MLIFWGFWITSFLTFCISSCLWSSGRKGNSPQRVPLPPPIYGAASSSNLKPSRPSSFEPSVPSYYGDSKPVSTEPSVPPYYGDSRPVSTAPPVTSSTYDNQVFRLLSSMISVLFIIIFPMTNFCCLIVLRPWGVIKSRRKNAISQSEIGIENSWGFEHMRNA